MTMNQENAVQIECIDIIREREKDREYQKLP